MLIFIATTPLNRLCYDNMLIDNFRGNFFQFFNKKLKDKHQNKYTLINLKINQSIMKFPRADVIAKILLSTLLIVFVWEHVGRKYDIFFRPAIGLDRVSWRMGTFFKHIGEFFGWMSSYLIQIDLADILYTIYDITIPIIRIILSPLLMVYGYFGWVNSYVGQEWLIYTGSFLLFILAGFCYKKKVHTYLFLKYIRPFFNFFRKLKTN